MFYKLLIQQSVQHIRELCALLGRILFKSSALKSQKHFFIAFYLQNQIVGMSGSNTHYSRIADIMLEENPTVPDQ